MQSHDNNRIDRGDDWKKTEPLWFHVRVAEMFFVSQRKLFLYQTKVFEANNKDFLSRRELFLDQREKIEANSKEFVYQREEFEANNKLFLFQRELFLVQKEKIEANNKLFLSQKEVVSRSMWSCQDRCVNLEKLRNKFRNSVSKNDK